MRAYFLIPMIIGTITAVLFVVIHYYGASLDETLGTQSAGNVLVIVLIVVDGLGGLSSFLIW